MALLMPVMVTSSATLVCNFAGKRLYSDFRFIFTASNIFWNANRRRLHWSRASCLSQFMEHHEPSPQPLRHLSSPPHSASVEARPSLKPGQLQQLSQSTAAGHLSRTSCLSQFFEHHEPSP